MEVTLLSSMFSSLNGGRGTHSKLIFESLKPKITVNKISQANCFIRPKFENGYLAYSKTPGAFYNTVSQWTYLLIDLKRILNKDKYANTDVFHAIEPFESLYIPKNKKVTSVLDFSLFRKNDDIIDKIAQLILKKCLKSTIDSDMIVALNKDVENVLISDYNVEKERIEVIHPIIDSSYHYCKKDNDKYVIGTVANLAKHKRIDILIKSFIEADIEDSELLIGGWGPEYSNLRNLTDDSRVKFLGYLKDEEMNDFYNSLDVFVFPSYMEGFGMPMVEAMACKKPVITLEDALIPPDVKDKTFITSKENLANVLKDKKYKCDINKNFEFYKEHSMDNISSKLIKVYEQVI